MAINDKFILEISAQIKKDANTLATDIKGIIDDIEKFLDVIGVEVLDLENAEDIRAALEGTLMVPNTGIIIVDNDEVFVYEHENY